MERVLFLGKGGRGVSPRALTMSGLFQAKTSETFEANLII
jgi:hypothetical protein